MAQSTAFAQVSSFLPVDTAVQEVPSISYHSLSIFPAGRAAILSWSTEWENSNAGFEIQYRKQGHWRKIGFQAGRKDSAHLKFYRFRTEQLPAGLHQFRLRQWSVDGKIEDSAPLSVRIYDRSLAWQLLATKTGPVVKMVLDSAYDEAFILTLFDEYGQLLLQQAVDKPSGSHQIAVDLTALAGQAYHWQLHNERGSWHQQLRQ